MIIFKRKRIIWVRYRPGERKALGSPNASSTSFRVILGYQLITFGYKWTPKELISYEALAKETDKFAENIDILVENIRRSYPWAIPKLLSFLKDTRKSPSREFDTQCSV